MSAENPFRSIPQKESKPEPNEEVSSDFSNEALGNAAEDTLAGRSIKDLDAALRFPRIRNPQPAYRGNEQAWRSEVTRWEQNNVRLSKQFETVRDDLFSKMFSGTLAPHEHSLLLEHVRFFVEGRDPQHTNFSFAQAWGAHPGELWASPKFQQILQEADPEFAAKYRNFLENQPTA